MNLIHRTSVPSDPEDDMNAAEDFMHIILESYIVAAAKEVMSMNLGLDGTLQQLAETVVSKFVRILPSNMPPSSSDQVFTYSCEVLSLGLLWLNYLDATREGDGGRVLALWKFLLIVFKKTGHKNYAKEAGILLIQYHCLVSERKAAQLKNDRFVNTKGREGCNMASDFFMEHLNHRLKGVIRHMGSNIQPHSLSRAAKAIGVIDEVCRKFEMETRGKVESMGPHSKPSSDKDFQCILDQLQEIRVFDQSLNRSNALKLNHCLLDSVDLEQIRGWLIENIVPGILYS